MPAIGLLASSRAGPQQGFLNASHAFAFEASREDSGVVTDTCHWRPWEAVQRVVQQGFGQHQWRPACLGCLWASKMPLTGHSCRWEFLELDLLGSRAVHKACLHLAGVCFGQRRRFSCSWISWIAHIMMVSADINSAPVGLKCVTNSNVAKRRV